MTTSLLVTIIAMVLIVAVGVGLWSRHHRIRPIIGGVGLALVPLGLYLLGVTDLAVNGVVSIIDWVQRTVWDDTMTWGASLAGGGLLALVISQFLPKGPKEPAPAPKQQPGVAAATKRPQVAAGQPAAAAKPAAGTAPAAGKATGGLTDEDREIEELLRKRGIG